MTNKKISNRDRQKIDDAKKILKEKSDKIDWIKLRQDGEELERLIGWRSLTIKDWHKPFTI